jgi:hypothetical protein
MFGHGWGVDRDQAGLRPDVWYMLPRAVKRMNQGREPIGSRIQPISREVGFEQLSEEAKPVWVRCPRCKRLLNVDYEVLGVAFVLGRSRRNRMVADQGV